MIGMIAAVGLNDVIGRNGRLPWSVKGDLKRFRLLSEGKALIAGRRTYESLPDSVLARSVAVVTSSSDNRFKQSYHALLEGINDSQRRQDDVLLIGGRRIYEEGGLYSDYLDITVVPQLPPSEGSVLFPFQELIRQGWRRIYSGEHPYNKELTVERWEPLHRKDN